MHENIIRIKVVAHCLAGLDQPHVFVGGATVSLYASNSKNAAIRPTNDVDVVIELATYSDHVVLEQKLRALGFANDSESGVICRYVINGIVVDIMPTTSNVLGFTNKWYPDGFQNAIPIQVDQESTVFIFPLPYFLAAKWEAHKARGRNDLRTSRDFEDMVFIFENCKDFDSQIRNGPASVREYFAEEFKVVLDHPDFEEALYAHMEPAPHGANVGKLIEKIRHSIDVLS